ncbi:unnamed protein product, partial [Ixodes pacificus]
MSLSDDALFAKLRDFSFQAGPVVALTRSLYERQLQQLLNNGSVPTTPSVPTDEFSAAEEEEEEEFKSSPRTTLTKRTVVCHCRRDPRHSPSECPECPIQPEQQQLPWRERGRAAESAFVHLQHPQQQPSSGRFTCPYDAAFQSTTRGEDKAGHSAATTPAVGKQQRMSMAVKVLIALVVITMNVLI